MACSEAGHTWLTSTLVTQWYPLPFFWFWVPLYSKKGCPYCNMVAWLTSTFDGPRVPFCPFFGSRFPFLRKPTPKRVHKGTLILIVVAERRVPFFCEMVTGPPRYLQNAGGMFSEADWPYWASGMYPCMPQGLPECV